MPVNSVNCTFTIHDHARTLTRQPRDHHPGKPPLFPAPNMLLLEKKSTSLLPPRQRQRCGVPRLQKTTASNRPLAQHARQRITIQQADETSNHDRDNDAHNLVCEPRATSSFSSVTGIITKKTTTIPRNCLPWQVVRRRRRQGRLRQDRRTHGGSIPRESGPCDNQNVPARHGIRRCGWPFVRLPASNSSLRALPLLLLPACLVASRPSRAEAASSMMPSGRLHAAVVVT